MQSAFAELEAGDEDVAEDETLPEADFERELHAMRREEDELRAALEAAKQTLTLTPTLTLTLTLTLALTLILALALTLTLALSRRPSGSARRCEMRRGVCAGSGAGSRRRRRRATPRSTPSSSGGRRRLTSCSDSPSSWRTAS